VCSRAAARIARIALPMPHRTNGYARLQALVAILGDESSGLSTAGGNDRVAFARFTRRLDDVVNYAHEAGTTLQQPTPDEVHSDYRAINKELGARVNRLVAAATEAPIRNAGCRPPPRLTRLLVAHFPPY
jgi:hypothetical protein